MERGTRAGSLAMFAHALASLASSLLLPMFAYSAAAGPLQQPQQPGSQSTSVLGRVKRAMHEARVRLSVSLPTMWAISLAIFSAAMLLTLATSTVFMASALLAVCGISWAVAMWVPFSMIGETIRGAASLPHEQMYAAPDGGDYVQVASGDIPMDVLDGHSAVLGADVGAGQPSPELSAGTILGVHNVFIVIPQFITAFSSSLIFAVFEHIQGSGEAGGQHARQIALVMSLGGLSAAGAAYLAWVLRRQA
ncbi:hypothetical protein GGF43_005557 [Coemansia sp. RSA 2618]|nr:hypothetical protein GGF43_005557 [Coemansia sp. RSA 2618]